MKYVQARHGRVFILRLEDGDIIHEEIERFAREQSIQAAAVIIVGGADHGSNLVVGPEEGRSSSIVPMVHILDNVHEIAGTGTIFPDEEGNPQLHMHIACGRKTSTITGCVRGGVRVWQIMEAVVFEVIDSTGVRVLDGRTGFRLLTV
ncbi:MAG: DNA-binding protein [Deltaproteobacteria bacterium]|nr:DNA-binding protein [Deltaproteobacteria bacterium]